MNLRCRHPRVSVRPRISVTGAGFNCVPSAASPRNGPRRRCAPGSAAAIRGTVRWCHESFGHESSGGRLLRRRAQAVPAGLQVERGIPGPKTQAAGCVTAVGTCGARRSVRHRPPDRDIARIEAAVEQGALLRVARVGLVMARVYGRTLLSSMPRCAHGRRPDCVADAVQSPPALRHCEFPPLRATRRARPVTVTGRARLARDPAPCPSCTASDRLSITTCISMRARPTASSCQPVTGRRPSCGQAACRRQLPARPITQADLAALTEKVRRRVVRWFRMQRFLDADAAADMVARENSGFSVDASVRITLINRDVPSYFQSLEHLLRYCARPPFALERLFVRCGEDGRITRVRYVLPRHKAASWVGSGRGRKSTRPGAGGLVELSPFEFLDRLADLVPRPRKHRHRPAGGWHGGRAKPRLWLRPPKAAGAMDVPAAVKQARGVRPESQAQVRRHGPRDRECRQAARCRDWWACGRRTCGARRCHRRLLRLIRPTAI
jgi:hypothetical protein